MLRQGGLQSPPPLAFSLSSEASSCTRACTWTASQQRARRDSPSSSAWRCSWCRALCARPPRVPSSLKCFEEAFSTSWQWGRRHCRSRHVSSPRAWNTLGKHPRTSHCPWTANCLILPCRCNTRPGCGRSSVCKHSSYFLAHSCEPENPCQAPLQPS